MALHIRDYRPSDAAALARLSETGLRLGALPELDSGVRILAGLRGERITAAIWFCLDGETGIIPAILAKAGPRSYSDVQELIAEASLWLGSRGAITIELGTVPQNPNLLAGLEEMHFRMDEHTGVMRRLVPARSAA
ncbi:hypothetical protein [Hyphomonas sp.]|uniref:hypothetical protein n=1 Tax=Hyphomonas sp. TaxID=87 RepID=UPI0025BB2655|nr:hypothetical protein [Hyphomonas sp.]MBI1399637.1 hypothetical protein [Hyphomonas sp.]